MRKNILSDQISIHGTDYEQAILKVLPKHISLICEVDKYYF
jgi:hypothetical protein